MEILNKLNGVALIDDGKNVKIHVKGYASFEENKTHTEDSNFKICSISKIFTAIAINHLVQRGMLKKDELISKYVGEYFNKGDIKIHHLLSHTSGIPNYVMYKKEIPWDGEYTKDSLLKIISAKGLKFKAGSKFSYSNTGYYILALIVEEVSRMKYEDYVKKYIFDVAKMSNTSFVKYNDIEFVISQAKGKKSKDNFSDSLLFGAGDVISNAKDLHKFAKALMGGKIISMELLNEMSKPALTKGMFRYGEGLFVNEFYDTKCIAHSGSMPGYSTQLSMYPDKGIVTIVLTNDRKMLHPLVYPEVNGKYIDGCIAQEIFSKKLGFFKKAYL